MTSQLSDPLSLTMHCEDGTNVVYKRCGFLPDVFASAKGHIIQVKLNTLRVVSGYPTLTYREGSMSARSLVADAWMPGWREQDGVALDVIDGNKMNTAVDNLKVVFGKRGRPTSDTIPKQAQIYQAFKVCPDPVLLADEYNIPVESVYDIIRKFNIGMLRKYLKTQPRRVRALHLTDVDFDEALAADEAVE